MNLLSLKEAAEILGYTERGLRKIVERSKAKSNGVRTHGPTIKFFQTEPSAPIKGLYGFLCQQRRVCYLLVKGGIRFSNMMAK